MRCLLRAGIVATALFCVPSLSSANDDQDPIGEDADSLPLFDAHVHYKEPAWGPYPPATILELMDETGVAMALVSSTPDEGTILLWQFAPERIVPELRPYHGTVGSDNWTKFPGMMDYLNERLAAYPHRGIGEFHLHRVEPEDRGLLAEVARVALAKDIFIHVHSGKDPVDLLFSLEPDLKIIWAHAGMSESAGTVERMMEKYDRLYADTSYREGDILSGANGIDPAWRRVLERFSDRFMVGSDTWINGQWDSYADIIAMNRQWLSHFPRPLAEKFAYKNAERLFGRPVGNYLLGNR